MSKQAGKLSLNIKKKLLSEIDSEASCFKKCYNNDINNRNSLLNNNNQDSSNEKNNESHENNKNNSTLNDLNIISINNSTNNNTKKNPIKDIKEENNPLNIYEEIQLYIEKFIQENINDSSSVFYILKEILNAIIIIINDYKDNNKNNNSSMIDNKDNLFVTREEDKIFPLKGNSGPHINSELDIQSKTVFLLKIQKLNKKIKQLKEEMEFYKSIIDIPKKGKIGKNFIELFKKKYMDQKSRNKKEEMNYLLCLREQEKQIILLEKKLKEKEQESLPSETIKSIRCFPNFHQYDFKEDINPKSIPLFQQFQKEKKIEKYLRNEMLESPKKISNSIKHKKKLIINNSSIHSNKKLLINNEFNKTKNNNEYRPYRDDKDKTIYLNKKSIYENR